MSTTPTRLPVPSEKPQDLKFNSGKIDEFVTSLQREYEDRFGNKHYTIEGIRWVAQQAIAAFGYITLKSFQLGAPLPNNELTLPNQVLQDETDGEYYRWDGTFPKVVPAGSTPDSTGGKGLGAWVGVGDASLRTALGANDGRSLIGEVEGVGAFSSLDAAAGKHVTLKGWYAGGAIGGGEFYYDPTVLKSKHDGGKYISPTVPYTTAQEFVSGTGETNPAGSGVWVRAGVTSELRGEWYGMLTGTVSTPMLSAMAKTAGSEGYGVLFPAGIFTLASSNVTFSFDNSPNGKTKYIKGAGKRATTFNVDTSSLLTYAITVTGSIGTVNAIHDMVQISGFSIVGLGSRATSNIYSGLGIMVQNTLGFTMSDINTGNLERGVTLQNSLYGLASSCRFQASKWGVMMRRNGLTTGVNAMEFLRCDFNDNAIFGVQMTESHAIKFSNCTFEGNGGKLDNDGTTIIAGTACSQSDFVGTTGGVGPVFDTCYFEGNTFIDIKHVVNINRHQTVTIRNCTFNKTRTDMTAPRIQMVNQLASGGASAGIKAVLGMHGNKFFSGTNNADAAYPDVEIAGFTVLGYGHGDFLDYDNTFTANTQVSRDPYVAWRKAPDDGFICRGLSGGGITNAASRNVISNTRQGTGIYRIITNQLTTAFTYTVQLDNAGFATVNTSENNESVTINTYDSAGVATDRNFRVMAKLL